MHVPEKIGISITAASEDVRMAINNDFSIIISNIMDELDDGLGIQLKHDEDDETNAQLELQ